MSLTTMSKEIHRDNYNKGFYDLPYAIPSDYVVMKQLLLIITEIAEATEVLRKDGINYKLEPIFKNTLTLEDAVLDFKLNYKDKFQDEIADTFIRLLDLCGYLDIDIDKWIEAKLEYNKTREYKHGKKF